MGTFLFNDDPCLNSGEGITRTTNPRAQLYQFEVRMDRLRPLRGTISATSRKQAEQFARARHPNATQITVHGRAA
jgi:hypothetical protein